MNASATCPKCGHQGKLPNIVQGYRPRCPKCKTVFSVPGQATPPPSPLANQASHPLSHSSSGPVINTKVTEDVKRPGRLKPLVIAGFLLLLVAAIGVLFVGRGPWADHAQVASNRAAEPQRLPDRVSGPTTTLTSPTAVGEHVATSKSEKPVEVKPQSELITSAKSEPVQEPNLQPATKPKPLPKPTAKFTASMLKIAELMSSSRANPTGFEEHHESSSELLFLPAKEVWFKEEKYKANTKKMLDRFQPLLNDNDPEIRRLAKKSVELFRLRILINLANEEYGWTANSTAGPGARMRFFGSALSLPGPNNPTEDRVKKAADALGNLSNDWDDRNKFSNIARFADYEAIDDVAKFWQDDLFKWIKVSFDDKQVISPLKLTQKESEYQGKKVIVSAFDRYVVESQSKLVLNNIILHAVFTTEWGEKSESWYYFHTLKPQDKFDLYPNRRVGGMYSVYSGEITIQCKYWCQEGMSDLFDSKFLVRSDPRFKKWYENNSEERRSLIAKSRRLVQALTD